MIVPYEGAYELYDLSKDPPESEDIAEENPELLRSLTAALLTKLAQLHVPGTEEGPPVCSLCDTQDGGSFWALALAGAAPEGARPPRPLSPETIQRLRDLGYAMETPDDGGAIR